MNLLKRLAEHQFPQQRPAHNYPPNYFGQNPTYYPTANPPTWDPSRYTARPPATFNKTPNPTSQVNPNPTAQEPAAGAPTNQFPSQAAQTPRPKYSIDHLRPSVIDPEANCWMPNHNHINKVCFGQHPELRAQFQQRVQQAKTIANRQMQLEDELQQQYIDEQTHIAQTMEYEKDQMSAAEALMMFSDINDDIDNRSANFEH